MNDTMDAVERTVQLTGNTTFTVSLPKEWAREQGIEAGKPVQLYPHRDRVIVAPTQLESGDRTARIDTRKRAADGVCCRVRAAYVGGADCIEVTNPDGLDRSVRRAVVRLVDRLVGMEIRLERDDSILACDLLDSGEVSLPQSSAQVRQHALEMHETAVTALRSDDDVLANRVVDRHDDVDRLAAFVTRGVHRSLEDVTEVARFDVDRSSALHHYRTVRYLGRVADHADRIAAIALRQSGPPDDGFAVEFGSIATTARIVVELALDADVDRALSRRSSVVESIDTLQQSLLDRQPPDTHLYGMALESVRRTATLGSAVAGVASDSVADAETQYDDETV